MNSEKETYGKDEKNTAAIVIPNARLNIKARSFWVTRSNVLINFL